MTDDDRPTPAMECLFAIADAAPYPDEASRLRAERDHYREQVVRLRRRIPELELACGKADSAIAQAVSDINAAYDACDRAETRGCANERMKIAMRAIELAEMWWKTGEACAIPISDAFTDFAVELRGAP